MKTDGLFTVHTYRIPVKSNRPIRLVLFGDVHRDSPLHAKELWQSDLNHFRSLKDAYFLGLGDYVDSASTSERGCLAGMGQHLHESTLNDLETLAVDKVKLLSKELGFMKDRLIGLMNGNHYFSFQDGTNTDMKLCGQLGCKYLGVSTFIRLTLDCYSRRTSLDIWAHHGSGAGRLLGGSINRVDQMREMAEADIYCMGHDHKRMAVPANPRMFLSHTRTGLKLKSRQQWLVRSGSYLGSYEDGRRNYNVDSGRGTCSLGHVELIVTMDCKRGRTPPEITIRALT